MEFRPPTAPILPPATAAAAGSPPSPGKDLLDHDANTFGIATQAKMARMDALQTFMRNPVRAFIQISMLKLEHHDSCLLSPNSVLPLVLGLSGRISA